MNPPDPAPAFPLAARTARRRAALAAALALPLFAGLFLRYEVLYDTDSYAHLAIARLYAHGGYPARLDWTRASAMGSAFGDKELLFHVGLAPFASLLPGTLGGRLALALLNSALVGLLAYLGIRLGGKRGVWVPVLLYLGAVPFFFRIDRLRPELGALALLLAATWAARQGHFRRLGLLALLFALSYTAWQALLGLTLLWLLAEWFRVGSWRWPLLLYPLAGLGLGLVIHPGFPANLNIWALQNVAFFLRKDVLDVGTEIAPPRVDVLFLGMLGLLVGLVLAARARAPRDTTQSLTAGRHFAIAASCFGLLALRMDRFVIYALPFACLALLEHQQVNGEQLGERVAITARKWLPFTPAMLGALLVGLPATWSHLATKAAPANPTLGVEEDRQRVGALLPQGATVAVAWGPTGALVFWAPQARYLDLFDPVFMAVPYPETYRTQADFFADRIADGPLTLATALASDYVVVDRTRSPHLAARLLADPRIAPLHAGYLFLGRVRPDANDSFVLDWRRVPSPAGGPGERYPRFSTEPGRRIEGFVDLHRFAPVSGCITVASELVGPAGSIELAAASALRVAVNGQALIELPGDGLGDLTKSVRVALPAGAAAYGLEVESCPPTEKDAPFGFYLRDY